MVATGEVGWGEAGGEQGEGIRKYKLVVTE